MFNEVPRMFWSVMLSFMVCSMALAQTGFDYTAPYTATPPTIDGVIDEGEYLGEAILVNPDTLNSLGGSMSSGDSANEALYWLSWDNDALYMAARVRDANVVYNSNQGGALNNTDGVQLCTDHQLLQSGGMDTPGIHIHDVVPGQADDNDTAAYWQHWNGNPPDTFPNAEWAGRTTAEGYEVELMLPWSDFTPDAPTPEIGMQMGYMLLMMDFDGPGAQVDLWWTGGGAIGSPADWNVLTLGEEIDLSLSVHISGKSLVVVGSEVALTAQVTHAVGDVSYVWYKDGQELPGEIFSTLLLSDVVEEDAGTYSVQVIDEEENIAEVSFVLTVVETLPLTSLPWMIFLSTVAVFGGMVLVRRQQV